MYSDCGTLREMSPEAAPLVYCVRCGSPDFLKITDQAGDTPIVERVNEDQAGWHRYWISCFKCGGKQFYDSPEEGLVVPPAPPILGDNLGLAAPTSDVKALANVGGSLASS